MTNSHIIGCAQFILLVLIAVFTASCAPQSVPGDASHEWDVIDGSVWFWGDKLEKGCTAWMATERWVSVFLVINSDCDADTRPYQIRGEKVSYSDFSDVLEFSKYGPWSYEIRDELTIFDEEGDFLGFKPCPHTITLEDISNMTLLAQEGVEVATTDGERQIMERIKNRLGKVDLSALSSSQFACTDAPLREPNKSPSN